MVRLGLSIVLFVVMSLEWYWTSFVLFVLAAGTDWIDGWWARKYNQVSQLGRILDPFCDKILICGTFILLAVAMRVGCHGTRRLRAGWRSSSSAEKCLSPRIRGFIEQSGGDFSAKFAGKLKMWFQCIAAGAGLVALAMLAASPSQPLPQWLNIVLIASIWLAVLSTVQSGIDYVVVAAKSLLSAAKSG